MTVNVIFPNILDVLYKQFHFSIKKTQNSGRYWAQVTCYLIVSVISVEACFVYRFLLLIWSPTLEKSQTVRKLGLLSHFDCYEICVR